MAIDPATPTFFRSASARSPRAKRPLKGLGGAADPPRIERQRARKLVTAAEAVRKFPVEGISDAGVNGRAGVSREAFEDHLEGREAALLAAFEHALAPAAARASAAYEAQEGWLDRVRAGLLALLEFFDEEPALARFCVVGSAQAGPAMLARRSEVLDSLALIIDDERAPARGYPPPLTAEAVVNGVLGVLHGRLSKPNPGPLVKLTGPLMSFVVGPFLGARAARMELLRPLEETSAVGRSVAVDLLEDPGGRRSHDRAMLVLRAVVDEPGLSNRELALRAGIKDEAQVSRVLARLARLGLIENMLAGRASQRPGS
jgi:AcrR family transcriptional regulator